MKKDIKTPEKENSGNQNNDKNESANNPAASGGKEQWKNPDPTTPERKNNPDPTKPEKEEGPYSDETNQNQTGADKKVSAAPGKNNPAQTESNNDEDIGSFEEQDIDDQGITGAEGEEKYDDESDEDVNRRKAS